MNFIQGTISQISWSMTISCSMPRTRAALDRLPIVKAGQHAAKAKGKQLWCCGIKYPVRLSSASGTQQTPQQ